MDITWIEILLGGSIIGNLLQLYFAQPKKEAAIIENLKVVIEEVKDHYNDYKRESEERLQSYKTEVEERLDKLETNVNRLELKNTFLQRCVNLSYRCDHAPKGSKCPVAEMSDSICDAIIEVREDFNKQK